MGSRTPLVPSTDPNPLSLDLDAERLAEFAVENRMEMLELELQLAIDASTVDFERNGTLPLFVLDYSYTINGLGQSYNDAFHELGKAEYSDYSVALRAEIPIGNLEARSRLRRAVLQRIQRLATREQRRLAIRQEVYDALDQLEQNWQRILAARQEVILAGRTYEAEKRQFEVGMRTSTEVLEAAARLAGAQSREIRALASYEIAQIDIAYSTGTLLGRGGVVWEPTLAD
jgi:outer membrane protein TolC